MSVVWLLLEIFTIISNAPECMIRMFAYYGIRHVYLCYSQYSVNGPGPSYLACVINYLIIQISR